MAHHKHPARILGERIAPGGLVWLEGVDIEHPEARRQARLPFILAVGRVTIDGATASVRERDLVLATVSDDSLALDALGAYARYVVATCPTIHARLTGRTLMAWKATGAS